MSIKLISTQVAAATLGVVGAGLILSAIDKAGKHGFTKVPLFEKHHRFTGELFENHRFDHVEKAVLPVY